MSAATASSKLSVLGVSTPLAQAGDPQAHEAVVFVHGNPGSHHDWDGLLAGAGEFARAIAFDMPGFGAAAVPAGWDYDVESYGRFLAEALDQLGVQRAHLVLHDFGGPFGLAWAAQRPASVASVTLIDTGVLLGLKPHINARIWRIPVIGELFQKAVTRSAWQRAMSRGEGRPLPAEFIDEMFNNYDSVTKNTVLKLYRVNRNPDEAARQHQSFFRSLDPPTLVVWGGRDPYLPVTHAEQQREAFPRAQVHVLPESGHWPFQDDPEAVAGVVLPFLRSQQAQADN